MRGHIVGPFVIVFEIIGVFRHEPVEKFFEIAARGGRGIFHDHETAARVLDEDCCGAHSDAALFDDLLDLIGDFVGSLALCADVELVVVNAHTHRRDASDQTGVRNER